MNGRKSVSLKHDLRIPVLWLGVSPGAGKRSLHQGVAQKRTETLVGKLPLRPSHISTALLEGLLPSGMVLLQLKGNMKIYFLYMTLRRAQLCVLILAGLGVNSNLRNK